jgi:membrane-bound lytic murein transglycosylase B
MRFILFCVFFFQTVFFATEPVGPEENFAGAFALFCAENEGPLHFGATLSTNQLEGLLKKAEKEGVKPKTFQEWLSGTPEFKPVFKVLESYARPRSVELQTESNQRNSENIVRERNVSEQTDFLQKHENYLRRIEKNSGVNAEILVAIFSAETRLGKGKLPFQAFAVFATKILFLHKMGEFNPEFSLQRQNRLLNMAEANLIALLRYAHKYNFAIDGFPASWAGACGPMQIMPFNFYLAEDGDGDGVPDINNVYDAMATAANFLRRRGWKKEDRELLASGQDDERLIYLLMRYNASRVYASGILNLARLLFALKPE